MIYYAIYNSDGKYLVAGSSESELTESEIPVDCFVYYGVVNIALQYQDIATNLPTDMPPMPQGFWVFDYTTKQWIPDVQQATKTVDAQRVEILTATDWTQIPNNPLTPTQQASWATYRQEIRDMSQQTGYPLNVVWPVAPI